MAELTHKERLQPSLLDRLTDEEPDAKLESRLKRILSLKQLKENVTLPVAFVASICFCPVGVPGNVCD